MQKYTPLKKSAIVLGGCFIANNFVMNMNALGDHVPPELLTAAFLCTIGSALCANLIEEAMRHGHYVKAVSLTGLACLFVAFSFTMSLERTAPARDGMIAEKQSANLPFDMAKQRASQAASAVTRLTRIIAKKESEITDHVEGRNAKKKGCGTICQALQSDVRALKEERANEKQAQRQAEADMAKAGAPIETDSAAKKFADTFGFVTAKQYATYQPMLLPTAMELAGILLLWFGFSKIGQPAPLKLTAPDPVRTAPARPMLPKPQSRMDKAVAAYMSEWQRSGERPVQKQIAERFDVPRSTFCRVLREHALTL